MAPSTTARSRGPLEGLDRQRVSWYHGRTGLGLAEFLIRLAGEPAKLRQQIAMGSPCCACRVPLRCNLANLRQELVVVVLVGARREAVEISGCAYGLLRRFDGRLDRVIRRRRDEWIAAGFMDTLLDLALGAYDRVIGLELEDIAVDGCITKAPCGGR